MRAPVLLFLPVVLAGCAWLQPAAREPSSARTATYVCDEGRLVLRVRFLADAAQVTLPTGEQLVLPQQRVASGMAYATPRHELRGKGDEATWTTGRRVPMACRVRP